MYIKLGEQGINLDFNYNALCTIEEALGFSVIEMAASPEKIGLKAIRVFIYAGAIANKPDITELKVGHMIDAAVKVGGAKALKKISEDVKRALTDCEILSQAMAEDKPRAPGPAEKKRHSRKSR